MRRSQARFRRENFLQNVLGYRFYRCQQCNWRGGERFEKKVFAKLSGWMNFALYGLALMLVVFMVFALSVWLG